MITCPADGCDYEGDGTQHVAAHWRWKHDGPCPLTREWTTCGICGEEFHYNPNRRTGGFCSNECKFKSRRSDIDESALRRAYKETESVTETAERLGLSMSVAWREIVKRGLRDPEPRNEGGRRDVECHACGETFSKRLFLVRRSERHYCSRECRLRWQAKNRKRVDCATCGNTLERPPYRLRKSENHYCDYDCRNEGYRMAPEEWGGDVPRFVQQARHSVWAYLALREETGQAWDYLPFEPDELVEHLEGQFTEGMTWDNYGKWHVDHVVPVVAFNFESPDDLDFQRCWGLDNLQPLWAKENLQKNASIDAPFQPSLKLGGVQ